MRNTFATYHPIIEFGFFCAVIGIGMFMIHPVFLAIGASAAFTYAVITGGKGSLKFTLCFLLPMILFIMVVNPLVNHQGMTVLFQLKYSYVTLEAVIYGLMMGLMLAAVLLWFSSYNKVMTSDKFTYLFGRIMPSISLVFTMVMRFIPNYQIQIKKIADARKAAGEAPQGKNRKDKIYSGMKIISIMFTWALENSIDSSDSMRARGYGLKNRSSFSIYRFDGRDGAAAVFLAVMTAIVLAGCLTGACHVEYYPEIAFAKPGLIQTASYIAFACICYFPVFVEAKEALVWKHLESKI